MDNTKTIKVLVALQLLCFTLYLVSSFYFESYLPDILQQYLLQDLDRERSDFDLAILFLSVPIILIYVVSSIGLLHSKMWAKKIFIVSVGLSFIITPFYGPFVDHGISSMFGWAESTLSGGIMALLLFSDSIFSKSNNGDR